MSGPMVCTMKEPCMPKYNVYHELVKRALIKDGWTIPDDPFNEIALVCGGFLCL
jgi:XisH protein